MVLYKFTILESHFDICLGLIVGVERANKKEVV